MDRTLEIHPTINTKDDKKPVTAKLDVHFQFVRSTRFLLVPKGLQNPCFLNHAQYVLILYLGR